MVVTTIATSGATALAVNGTDRDIAITPDGSRFVYRGNNNQLLVRALNQLEPTVLSGVGEARSVFISPDGQRVGFFDGLAIKKVAIAGGPPEMISPIEGNPRGAAWRADGSIIFATSSLETGLQRVSAAGGEPVTLTTPDRKSGEGDHLWPELLPGGEAVLFTISPAPGVPRSARVAVLDLRAGTWRVLIDGGSHARYVPSGHLLYGVAGTLRAVAFNLQRLEVAEKPAVLVREGVMMTPQGAADIAVANNGLLVYVPGGPGGKHSVEVVDRQGRASALPGIVPDAYRDVMVSPNGERLALATTTDVWTYDVRRAVLSQLTTDPAPDRSPLWTPDGDRIIYTSTRTGYAELFRRLADGTGSDEPLLGRGKKLTDLLANGWSPDGRRCCLLKCRGAFNA